MRFGSEWVRTQSLSSSYRRTSVSLKNRERGIAEIALITPDFFFSNSAGVSFVGCIIDGGGGWLHFGMHFTWAQSVSFQRTNLGLSEKVKPQISFH
jgi:hypothetical protein